MDLETKRCIIRRFTMDDLEELYSVLSDPTVMEHLEPPFDRKQTVHFLQDAGLCDPPLVYGLVWKPTGRLIGHVIYHPYEQDEYEIGWVIHRDFWGMGIATEVTEALIDSARQQGVKRLVIEYSSRQTTTKRISDKFGFTMCRQEPLCCCKLEL